MKTCGLIIQGKIVNNLLRKCENCVSAAGRQQKYEDNGLVVSIRCQPRLPNWLYARYGFGEIYYDIVPNHTAESCDAFRLRDTGVNE